MSISVTCPDCGHTFSIREEFAGRRGKCPRCKGVFRAEPHEPAVEVAVPANVAARSGTSLGGSPRDSGGFVVDPAAPSRAPAPAGRKSGGKRRSARGPAGPAMPLWGWITIATLGVAAFVGGGFVYMSRGNEAVRIAERIDDGSEAESTKQKLLDEIKRLEDEIAGLKKSLADAEKKVGAQPKEGNPLGAIEERIIPGVVKVIPYVGDRPQQNTATGFLIDAGGKVLVATTHRVCEGANKIGIKLPTGTEYEVEGIVAAADKQDIAILKPKADMPGVKTLALAENPTLNRGDTVYAIGNPGKQEFTTSRGVVTRVLPQDKYLEESPKFDIAMRRDTINANFIEHDARIFPGDYGGPLLNENLEVVGMNQVLVTMVMNDGRTIVQTFGAAEEIARVKALAAKATDTIIPYPDAPQKPPENKSEEKPDDENKPADDGDEAKPDEDDGDAPSEEPDDGDDAPAADDLAGKIDALYKECEAFEWTPESKEEYAKLADIARRVTEAKELADDDEQKQAADAAVGKVTDRLKEIDWDDSSVEALNKLAADAKPAQDAGICFVGTVQGGSTFNGASALAIQIDDTDVFAIVPSEKASEFEQGTRGMVLGQYMSDETKSISPDGATEITAILVRSKALIVFE